ncbi:hypothetical protein [Streptomyces sp. NPDC088725]|uniref:hypothetical protein n=1 Tax=Streptomyces sp. NPDC088725 TaxID=3365873 RepID=UPI00382C8176
MSPAEGTRAAVTYAVVKVKAAASAGDKQAYSVDLKFTDDVGGLVDFGDARVVLDAGRTKTVKVGMDDPAEVALVRDCEVLSVTTTL